MSAATRRPFRRRRPVPPSLQTPAGKSQPREYVRLTEVTMVVGYGADGIGAWESSNESLSVSGRPRAFDRFRSANAFAFELISTQRLKRGALPSIRSGGVGRELLDIAFRAEM